MSPTATQTDPFVIFCLRIPKSLHLRLKIYALQQETSVNALLGQWAREALDYYQANDQSAKEIIAGSQG